VERSSGRIPDIVVEWKCPRFWDVFWFKEYGNRTSEKEVVQVK
jgi:hypothetical protein